MTDVSREAIEAAAVAMSHDYDPLIRWDAEQSAYRDLFRRRARVALAVAAPLLRADEREACAREVEAIVFSWGWTGDFQNAGDLIVSHVRAGGPTTPKEETPDA